MLTRKHSSKATVIRKDYKTDGENEYIYELTMKEGTRLSNFKIQLYSVQVKMINSNGETSQTAIKDAFSNAALATKFYDKIVEGLATPIDLRYIAEDEIG